MDPDQLASQKPADLNQHYFQNRVAEITLGKDLGKIGLCSSNGQVLYFDHFHAGYIYVLQSYNNFVFLNYHGFKFSGLFLNSGF